MKENNDLFDHLKKKEFTIPDTAYFNSLADKVILENQVKKKTFVMRPVIWITAAAAIIILAIIIVKPTTSYVQPDFTQLAFNDISSTEAENYINANLNDFEIDLIEELIISDNAIQENSDTTKTQPNEVKQTVTFDNISKEDILNYFENENIDIEDLEEESFI
jgi:hypothetical protein